MFYEVEELALFWASLEALDVLGDHERMAKAVDILTSWAVQDPKRAAPNDEGVRVLKLPSTEIDGGLSRPLRLAYHLTEGIRPSGAAGVVTLFHVEMYDEQQDLLENAIAPWH